MIDHNSSNFWINLPASRCNSSFFFFLKENSPGTQKKPLNFQIFINWITWMEKAFLVMHIQSSSIFTGLGNTFNVIVCDAIWYHSWTVFGRFWLCRWIHLILRLRCIPWTKEAVMGSHAKIMGGNNLIKPNLVSASKLLILSFLYDSPST